MHSDCAKLPNELTTNRSSSFPPSRVLASLRTQSVEGIGPAV